MSKSRPLVSVFQVVPPCGGHQVFHLVLLSAKSFKSCPRVGGIQQTGVPSSSDHTFQVVPPCGGHP